MKESSVRVDTWEWEEGGKRRGEVMSLYYNLQNEKLHNKNRKKYKFGPHIPPSLSLSSYFANYL